jgi:hypothetical protein
MYRPELIRYTDIIASRDGTIVSSSSNPDTLPNFIETYSYGDFPPLTANYFNGNMTFAMKNHVCFLPTWTIEFWFVENSPNNETAIFSDGGRNILVKRSNGYVWTYSSSNGLFYSSVPTVISNSSLQSNGNHIVITFDWFDNRTVRFYHNGVLTASKANSPSMMTDTLYFGNWANNSYYWKGWIGGLAFYPFAMPFSAVALRFENKKILDYDFSHYSTRIDFSSPTLGEKIGLSVSEEKILKLYPTGSGGTYKYAYKDIDYTGRLLWQMEAYNACDTAKLNLHIEQNGQIVASSHWHSSNVVKCNTRRQWVKMWALVHCTGITRFILYPRPNADTFDSGYQLFRSMSAIDVVGNYAGGWIETDERIDCIRNGGYLPEPISGYAMLSSNGKTDGITANFYDNIKYGYSFNSGSYFTKINRKFGIQAPSVSPLRPSFTVNMWIRPQSSNRANYKGVFGLHNNYRGVAGLQYENGLYRLAFGNGSSWVYVYDFTTSQIPDNKWSMVTWNVTYGGYHRVFLNGELVGSGSYGQISVLSDFCLGRAYNDSDRNFHGYINKFTVYRAILSDGYIGRLYGKYRESMEVRGGDTIVTARLTPLGTSSIGFINYSTNYKECMVLSTAGMPSVSPRNYSQLGRWLRYFRCSTNGNSVNSYNHIVQIQIVDVTGKEVSKGRGVTGDWGSSSRPTNGDLNTETYIDVTNNWSTIDLGDVHCIRSISVWHYYGDGRSYNNNYWEISEDNNNWIRILDSYVKGNYNETKDGMTVYLGAERGKWSIDAKTGTLVAPGIEVL